MNKNYLSVFGALVVGLVLGFFLFHSAGAPTFGAITPSTKTLNSQDLTNELSAISAPLTALKNGATLSLAFPAVSSSSILNSTTTVVTSSIAQGDFVFVSPSTSTLYISYVAQVITAGATTSSIQIHAINGTSTAVTPTATTFNYVVLPAASFVAPTGL